MNTPVAPPPRAPDASPAPPAQHFAETHRPPPTFTDPDRRKKLATAFAAIDKMVDAQREKDALPGLAFGIVIDGELALAKGSGFADVEAKRPVDADTVFRLGSITKTFTATVLVKLRDRGALALDEPATRLLPELGGVVYPTRDAPPITLRHLANHSSGLPRMGPLSFDAGATPEPEMLKALQGMALDYAPGTDAVYSNLAFALLGIAEARAAKTSYRELVAREIAGPLGMTSLAWDAKDVPAERLAVGYGDKGRGRAPQATLAAFEPAGAIFASLRDTAKYVAFQLAAYPARDDAESPVARRSSVRETHAPAATRSLRVYDLPKAGRGTPKVDARTRAVGLAWHAAETCDYDLVVDHNGAVSGYESQAIFLPSYGVGFVVLANARGGDLDGLAERALAELAKTGGLAPRKEAPSAPSPALTAALARYLEVQNEWNEPAYLAMLDEGHKKNVPMAREREEIATYRSRHGRCTPGAVVEVLGPTRAIFAPKCEKGRLELRLMLGADPRLIAGFGGVSFDVPPDATNKRLAGEIVGLTNKWSDAGYEQTFGKEFGLAKDEVKRFLGVKHDDLGACKLGAPKGVDDDGAQEWRLACERGPEVTLMVMTRKDGKKVGGYTIRPDVSPKCPVK